MKLARRPLLSFLLERFGPALLGVGAGASVTRLPMLWLLCAPWRDRRLDKAIDVEVGLLAGLLAIVAFLPALEDKTVIRNYLREAVWASGLTLLLSLAIITFPDSWRVNVLANLIASFAWWGLVVYSVAAGFRIVKLALKSLLAN